MRGANHGNFHFYSGDLIQLKKRGHLLLFVHGLETLYNASVSRSWHERKGRNYYWQEFNSDIQKVIDEKLAECRLANRAWYKARKGGYV